MPIKFNSFKTRFFKSSFILFISFSCHRRGKESDSAAKFATKNVDDFIPQSISLQNYLDEELRLIFNFKKSLDKSFEDKLQEIGCESDVLSFKRLKQTSSSSEDLAGSCQSLYLELFNKSNAGDLGVSYTFKLNKGHQSFRQDGTTFLASFFSLENLSESYQINFDVKKFVAGTVFDSEALRDLLITFDYAPVEISSVSFKDDKSVEFVFEREDKDADMQPAEPARC